MAELFPLRQLVTGLIDTVRRLRVTVIDASGTEVDFNDLTVATEPATQMVYYGATVADRPDADEVAVGAVFMAVDTGIITQSNGVDTWVVL
jgi:hypothetical protein